MAEKHHHYAVTVTWIGNQGAGTASYRGYSRNKVTLAPGTDLEQARSLHRLAHQKCFIARSVNFPVEHEVELILQPS
ncbi:OsmC family protein [Pseudomonas putida]|uniref:OsmC family peroxiredoxin n=1 Tax=Pseudomonas putida TaxID=303 RepID=A0A177SQZ8_PSEPU|nr:hypothetical protein [Pseudomonas putida]OAI92730.1 hypothetical protein AYO28_17225 [Pseudomonas putida]